MGAGKGPDYVYFERKPGQFGETIAQKSTAAKMRLELYYKETVEGVVGRKERYVESACGNAGSDANIQSIGLILDGQRWKSN